MLLDYGLYVWYLVDLQAPTDENEAFTVETIILQKIDLEESWTEPGTGPLESQ